MTSTFEETTQGALEREKKVVVEKEEAEEGVTEIHWAEKAQEVAVVVVVVEEDMIQITEAEEVVEADHLAVAEAVEEMSLMRIPHNETIPEPEERSLMPETHQTLMVTKPRAAAKFAAAAEKHNWVEDFTTNQMWEKLDKHFTDGKLPKKAAKLLEVTRQGKKGVQEFLAWFKEKCGEAGYYWHEPDREGSYLGEDPTHIQLLDKSL
ncbi:hypothetical protein VKT23_015600 [Stygiomarasmius scandens]|uniref:Retrotransposon gag domain-containing protein n=1 Tax=Marasmiellus scandens TaxID=2682957 RepID=A0ABR1IXN4_9AGAR